MSRYLAKRLMFLVPTLVGVSVFSFALIHLIPGDLVTILLGITASQNEVNRRAIIAALHLDQSLPIQYLLWARGVLTGDFGKSLVTGLSVKTELLRSFPVTLELTVMSMMIALLLGLPMGIISATRTGRAVDLLTRTGSLLFISAPAFFVGTVIIVVGARYAPWLPTLGYVPFSENPMRSLLTMLPAALSLGAAISAILLRFTRSSVLEVLDQEYVRTARAKGVWERRVIYGHALRNAIIPVLAMAGAQFVYLIGGAVVIEDVFALPGVGRLVVNAINQRDYTMIQGAILVLTAAAVLINLLLDMAYHAIDPRIVYG
jgi:peptide/nickel transport system permease protein